MHGGFKIEAQEVEKKNSLPFLQNRLQLKVLKSELRQQFSLPTQPPKNEIWDLDVQIALPKGVHIYSFSSQEVPKKILPSKLELPADFFWEKEPVYSFSVFKWDEVLKKKLVVFEGQVKIQGKVRRLKTGKTEKRAFGYMLYQACNQSLCFLPQKLKLDFVLLFS